ncbi:hypothetical protein Y032_0422g1189 [Ancylostoma ceylanicum]|uniref:Uncharacterized protein n=1 Tax=Ancylostoma ceylanicum TaxID=53326 RepID=A0A016X271_9BILA|nr:hypothetical protein Y032_0422g1189 [Ancylostoma ceylanicum]
MYSLSSLLRFRHIRSDVPSGARQGPWFDDAVSTRSPASSMKPPIVASQFHRQLHAAVDQEAPRVSRPVMT